MTTSLWATTDDLGILAFPTKKAAIAAYPNCRPLRCEFALGFLGWIAIDPHGSDNGSVLLTPDRREVRVVMGWYSAGRLIGFRGGSPRARIENEWRTIMARVVEAGLQHHEYKMAGNG